LSSFDQVSVESVRDYWNRRPCNIRHSPKAVGSREYFDEVEGRKYMVEPHIPPFASFERWRDKKVLELGCGIGTDTINFARHGAAVTVAELSEESMKIAQQRAEVFGVSDCVEFYNGNAEELMNFVPIDEYDLIYSFGVIHHSPHPERILDQARRYARRGSTLKVMVYNRRSWKVLWMVLKYGRGDFSKSTELIAEHSEAQTGSPVTYAYTKRELEDMLSRYGFRVTELFVDHIFPWRIRDYVEYRYVKVWYFRWLPEALFRRLERTLGWHLCATAIYDPKQAAT
jgi:ubiquinone/menaquinone biosynthesis C-methylase UbiE